MRNTGKTALLICLAWLAYISAETVTMSSNPFTFPEITGISKMQPAIKQTFFKHSGINPFTHTVTFNWSLPEAAKNSIGTITVYSLLGRVVKELPVTHHTGSVTWKFSDGAANSGLYIVRIRCGNQLRNIKLMLWN